MTTFEFSIGGYMGSSYNVSANYDSMFCDSFGQGYTPGPIMMPLELANNTAWNEVVAYLSTRKWKPEYIADGVCDGTHWSLNIETDAFTLRSGGSNAYPPGFYKFLKLLNVVLKENGMEVG